MQTAVIEGCYGGLKVEADAVNPLPRAAVWSFCWREMSLAACQRGGRFTDGARLAQIRSF